jgi:hypothetical protein
MRILNSIALAAASVLLAGCASTPQFAELQPVGPAPAGPRKGCPVGRLQVYSAPQAEPIQMEGGEWWRWDTAYASKRLPRGIAHSSYLIRTNGGHLVEYVRNAKSAMDPIPTVVTLPPGQYEVQAQAEAPDGSINRVLLSVVIQPGKTTVVHLVGNWKPHTQYMNKQVVRLPDGQIAGWLASR